MSNPSIISLSDDEFFTKYCRSAHIVFNHGKDEMVFIKDKNHDIIYMSLAYRNAFPSETLGSSLREDPQAYEKELAVAKAQDEQIKQTRQSKTYIYIDDYQHISHVHKRPLINPSTNNFVGILGVARHFLLPNILKLICKINDIKIETPTLGALKYELTERQSMVLFLYVNKYSNAEIADIMSIIGYKISKSRVNDHLENLKYIFQAKTKEELIKKAVAMNYHLLVPRQFLKSGSYALDDELIISSDHSISPK